MGNTPNVRFKGFTEDWEQRKLGDVAQEFKSGNSLKADEIDITGDYPVYGGNGLRGYTSTYNHDGEYALIGRQGALCGNMNYSVGKAYFTEHAVVVKADESNDTRFLYYMLDTMNLGQYSDQSAQPGLAVNKLVKLENRFPTKEEQQQIGWYFSNLDHLITLHQQKCDETKEFKKYMLQNMFPQKDEKVPKIRFDGFTEDWEQRKLGDLVIIERGGSPRPINKFITEDENGLNWVKIGDAPEQGNYITQTKEKIRYEGLSKTREVHPGDLILSNSMSFGRPYIMAIDGCIHDGWLLIRDNEKRFDLKYLCYMLGTDMMLSQYKQMAAGSTVNNLNKELVGNTVVKYPSLEEQSKMGDYFSIFDNLITLHQQKCNALKEFKKYMLQNMFPQKGENKCQN